MSFLSHLFSSDVHLGFFGYDLLMIYGLVWNLLVWAYPEPHSIFLSFGLHLFLAQWSGIFRIHLLFIHLVAVTWGISL